MYVDNRCLSWILSTKKYVYGEGKAILYTGLNSTWYYHQSVTIASCIAQGIMRYSINRKRQFVLRSFPQVSSAEVYYKGVSFYIAEHPDLINDLLRVLEARIDHSRVVDILRRADHLPLIKDYLTSVQKNNLLAVNEAMNELLVEEEDFDALRSSITTYDNFDQLALAQRLENHGLIEFRRIAAMVYKQNLKWEKAISLSKSDRLYKVGGIGGQGSVQMGFYCWSEPRGNGAVSVLYTR